MSDTAFALLAVLAVLGVLVVGFRSVFADRMNGLRGRAPSPAGVLEVLGKYPVGRGVVLILLRVDRRVLLISQSPGGRLGGATMTTLSEMTDAEDVASVLTKVRDAEGDSLAARFSGILAAYESSPENAVPPSARTAGRTVAQPDAGRLLDIRESPDGARSLRERINAFGGGAR